MTDAQWRLLLETLDGCVFSPPPAGFIIDSPWLPRWAGLTILDYLAGDEPWLEANLKAQREFPGLLFLPGFWAEYGMCTEPSVFGARCVFPPDEFPFAHPAFAAIEAADGLKAPDPATDGLAPFVLSRLTRLRPRIESAGHRIRFSVSRGPLNVASFLLGVDGFLTALVTDAPRVHRLLGTITDYLVRWHALQRAALPSIDGILVLDDIIGFIGAGHFREFGLPYFKAIFAPPAAVKFLHNDAEVRPSAPFLREMGVNLFNPGFEVPLAELRTLAGPDVALLGSLPPRDVLAQGTPDAVRAAVWAQREATAGQARIILSCGGGMPPGVPTANIRAFIEAAGEPNANRQGERP
jgi:uroporphyrinogen-III decarboxylase